MTLDQAIEIVRSEYKRAERMFGAFNSAHEGYAVLLEEVDELWTEVKENRPNQAKLEAIQVAAMALRFLVDVDKE